MYALVIFFVDWVGPSVDLRLIGSSATQHLMGKIPKESCRLRDLEQVIEVGHIETHNISPSRDLHHLLEYGFMHCLSHFHGVDEKVCL